MFTPVQTSLGALLLFHGSSGLLFHNGVVFGISSLVSGCIFNPSRDNVPIVAGLMSSIIPVCLFAPSLIPDYPASPNSLGSLAATMGVGFLLGWGTKNGRGCTSGHMLCGLSRLSPRSLIATAVFFTTALVTANISGAFPSCGTKPCYTAVSPTGAELVFMGSAVVLAGITNMVVVPKALSRSENSQSIFSYLAGLEFGLGLLISGMADSAKVLRFFAFPTDISRFDPSLALIIVFGIGPSLLAFLTQGPGQATENRPKTKPTLSDHWKLPTATVADIDWRFLAGAAAFGVAWGLRGVCPGPALLRGAFQPLWGVATLGGYILGNLF
ncbi:hypothetical protein N7468_006472 [Penicillium chermesinum]|uniref:YeeE/YedE family integral membrane protein n=1 Tax=Penicillium chermesinum TaxID=63820 RepID=A0A9W9NSA5_9EURO|nr:uncharacterized protein N7468_006472 [Penicillium chermesinum]KAJ5225247.1 hypothetical protein N7468_006472 [Penicillium chermesinum]